MKKVITNSPLFSVGKVAKAVGVKEHTIRSWQTLFPHIKYILGKGQRRYYNQKAIDQFAKINELMYTKGMKIAGIQKLIKYGSINDSSFNNDDFSQQTDNFFANYIDNEDSQSVEESNALLNKIDISVVKNATSLVHITKEILAEENDVFLSKLADDIQKVIDDLKDVLSHSSSVIVNG